MSEILDPVFILSYSGTTFFLSFCLLMVLICITSQAFPLVLQSYMEDHLKNKDRLDREWEALCAYEADPASTKIASDASNSRKNRYTDTLPCKAHLQYFEIRKTVILRKCF